MKTKQLLLTAMVAMSCFAGAASAQDYDRRGPNVMPAPQGNGNYYNNTNTYDRSEAQSRRCANVMQAPESQPQARATPRAERSPAAPESAPQLSQGGQGAQGTQGNESRSGPNIVGEAAGLPAESPRDNGRRTDAVPGCDKCVAI